MPVKCQKIDGKYRVVEVETGRIAMNAAMTALDGGGHATAEACAAQSRAINAASKGREQAAQDE
jgi:nanoRNase/pAp phosphatase (c-di-AMP/oligoRNAs hydrolase)